MLRLVKLPIYRDILAVLTVLIEMAVNGELLGMVLCYRTAQGRTEVLLTGLYRSRPENALGAAARIHMAVSRQLDLFT